MTFIEKYIQRIVEEKLKKFPYLSLCDPFGLIDEAIMSGYETSIFKSENDYPSLRHKIDEIKKFQPKQTLLVLRCSSDEAEETFPDIAEWTLMISISPNDILTEHVLKNGIPEPLEPLAALILKRDLVNRLEEKWKETKPTDRIKELFISVILNEDFINAVAREEKVKVLFRVLYNPKNYEQATYLLGEEKYKNLVEELFYIDNTFRSCFQSSQIREKICKIMLGLYSISNLPNRREIAPAMFERLQIKVDKRRDLFGLFELLAKEMPVVIRDFPEESNKFLEVIDQFAREYRDDWFNQVELKNAKDVLQGTLLTEFEWIELTLKKAIHKGIPLSKQDVSYIGSLLEIARSWFIVEEKTVPSEKYMMLKDVAELLNLMNEFPEKAPNEWNDWSRFYENTLLRGDVVVSKLLQYGPIFTSDKMYAKLQASYLAIQTQYAAEYENWLLARYPTWIEKERNQRPRMPIDVIDAIINLLEIYDVVFLVIYDGMRVDFWNKLRVRLEKHFVIEKDSEKRFCSLLPSITKVSREAIFIGDFPEEVKMIKETGVLQERVKGIATVVRPTSYVERTIRGFNELIEMKKKSKKEVRVFVAKIVDEIAHTYRRSGELYPALQHFDERSKTHVNYLKRIKEIENSVLLITTDHGFAEISELEQVKIPENGLAIVESTGRCAFLRVFNPRAIDKMSKNIYILTPKDLNIKKHPWRMVDNVVFNRGKSYFSLKRRIGFSHGSVSLYETIIPFCVLVPKRD